MEPVRSSPSYTGILYNIDVLFDVLQALVSDALSSPLSADAVAARQLDCWLKLRYHAAQVCSAVPVL